jgi:hypothetical protein
MKSNILIQESPDLVEYQNEYYDSYEKDAIGFGWLENQLLTGHTRHFEMKKGYRRKDYQYPGRLWTDAKIISFWDYPSNKTEMKKLIEELEAKIGIPIWEDEAWLLEIEDSYVEGDEKRYEDDYYFIPLKNYEKPFIPYSEERRNRNHTMSPLEKEKRRQRGEILIPPYRKRKKSLAWQQVFYQEKKIMNFQEFESNSLSPINYNCPNCGVSNDMSNFAYPDNPIPCVGCSEPFEYPWPAHSWRWV